MWSFTTIVTIPAAPSLIAPENGATEISTDPEMVWHISAGATSYQLQLSLDSGFNKTVRDQSGIMDTTYQVMDLSDTTTYYWRVRASNAAGTGPWSSVWSFTTKLITSVEGKPGIPTEYNLAQNYPNPFNPTTNIVFELPKPEFVKIKVYSILGKEVATIVSQRFPAGRHTVIFDASGLSSGIYLYRLITPSFVQTRKMLLVR